MNPLSLATSAVAASILSVGKRTMICDGCGTPVAELIGGFLVIKSKHHGEQHITVLNLVSLAAGLKLL
jgi:hypothetical protein